MSDQSIKCLNQSLELVDQLINENIILDKLYGDFEIGDSWTVYHLKKLKEMLQESVRHLMK